MTAPHEEAIRRLRKLLPASVRRRLPRRIAAAQVTEATGRRLNMQYLRRRSPANVLSFRYGDEYGEILVCPSVIRREARRHRNPYRFQLTWMIVHGMIHLSGLHHEESRAKATEAIRIEQQILKILKKIRGKKPHHRA